jgi:tRNA dimethylallyltransferase
LDPRNVRRVIRALEIHQATGNKPSEFSTNNDAPFTSLVVGLTMDRKALYRRIDERVDRMMEDGLLAEVKTLVAAGHTPGQGPLGSPGYRELGLYSTGKLSLEEAVQRTKTQTHRLARRQYNWFKLNDPRIHWLDASGSGVDQEAAELVAGFLTADSPVIQ